MRLDLQTEARRLRPALDVSPELRGAAIATWRQRMLNEYGSAPVFTALAAQLEAAGAAAAEVDAVVAMAAEEHHHGLLCASVVEALGGDAIGDLRAEEAMPEHPEVDRIEAVTRNLLSVGCLSETVAVALISAERHRMAPGPLRTIITQILADEVGHARLGWRWMARQMPRFDAAAKARLGSYLAVAFAHFEAHEHQMLPLGGSWGEAGEALGLCEGGEARALFHDTVREVIVPRLEALGLPARRAWQHRHASGGSVH